MKLIDIEKRAPIWFKEQIAIYLRSAPGLGKTSTIVNVIPKIASATGMNLGLSVINGGLLTPQDAIGYLIPDRKDDHIASQYTRPFWWVTPEGKPLEAYDGGVIFIDEADKMEVDTKKVVGEAAESQRLGPHMIAPNWVVWMAGNRKDDQSGSTKELFHLINRRLEIDVDPCIESWTHWATAHDVSPLSISFANVYPESVFQPKTPKDIGQWCTPRSLVKLDNHVKMLQKAGASIQDAVFAEEVAGFIGEGAGAQYTSHIRLQQEMPKFESIVQNPDTTKVPTKSDAQMLICYNLAHRVSHKTADSVITYVDRMDKEFAVTFARAACNRDSSLAITKAFQKWANSNASLMAAIAL